MNAETQAIQTLLARSAFYHALSVCWRHPEGDTARWLKELEHRRILEIAEQVLRNGNKPLFRAMERLVQELDSVTASEWARQHEQVFGHSVKSAAPAYELEYGQPHEHRQPQALSDIAAFYQAFGLRISPKAHERADHIVTECEFLEFVLYKQACALDDGHQEQAKLCEEAARQFLADHLGRWGPAFCVRLSRAAAPGLFRTMAQVTLHWLAEECARLRVPAGPPDLPLRLRDEEDGVDCSSCLQERAGA